VCRVVGGGAVAASAAVRAVEEIGGGHAPLVAIADARDKGAGGCRCSSFAGR
jgi:hypothetical protein